MVTRTPARAQKVGAALTTAIVVLALSTAVIHVSLGGLLFLMNAVGFGILAVAQVFPGRVADRLRILPRLALIGFSATTIIGWVLFGARYDMGYLATGIEVAIVVLTSILVYRESGSPLAIARRGLAFASR